MSNKVSVTSMSWEPRVKTVGVAARKRAGIFSVNAYGREVVLDDSPEEGRGDVARMHVVLLPARIQRPLFLLPSGDGAIVADDQCLPDGYAQQQQGPEPDWP
jgi:hypothetical protein